MGRLSYIDWMRGLACLLMFQTHCFDSWLAPAERDTTFMKYSQLLGTFPAPLFLFLAGVSLALGIDRMTEKGIPGSRISLAFATRGLEIFALGLLFRLQEFLIVWGWAPTSDLFRVDVLNTIGLSLMIAGLLPLVFRGVWLQAAAAAAVALAVAMLTPPLWTTHKPDFLPWWLASYINGGHTDFQPKPWLFPLFPWMAFTFAGCAAGLLLMRARHAKKEPASITAMATAGVALVLLSRWLDHLPVQFYAVYDYWHTSPNFFLARLGILLVILGCCFAWCAVKPGELWSPVEQIGTTSLLVYWVHIEFVYGRFSILPRRASSLEQAALGLAAISASMILLSVLRTRTYPAMKRLWAKGHS